MRLVRVGVRVVLCAWLGLGVELGLGSELGLGLGPGLGEGLGQGEGSSEVPCASMCSGVRPVRGVRQLVTWWGRGWKR